MTELVPTAERINAEHRACAAAMRTTLTHAIRAGEMLSEVKASLDHGEWLPWLRENFEGSERVAQTYMKLARNREALKSADSADLSIDAALRELEPPKDDGLPMDWREIPGLLKDLGIFQYRLWDDEKPVVAPRLKEPDSQLIQDFGEALEWLDSPSGEVREILENFAYCGWLIERAAEKWFLRIVEREGTAAQKARRYKYEGNVRELESHPEAWEVFWHVTQTVPIERAIKEVEANGEAKGEE